MEKVIFSLQDNAHEVINFRFISVSLLQKCLEFSKFYAQDSFWRSVCTVQLETVFWIAIFRREPLNDWFDYFRQIDLTFGQKYKMVDQYPLFVQLQNFRLHHCHKLRVFSFLLDTIDKEEQHCLPQSTLSSTTMEYLSKSARKIVFYKLSVNWYKKKGTKVINFLRSGPNRKNT